MSECLIWLVPLGVALLGVWRPRHGLALLVGCLPLFGSPPAGPYMAALDVAAIVAILLSYARVRHPAEALGNASALTWPVRAFALVSMASLVPFAYQPPSWRPGLLLALAEVFPNVEHSALLYTWRALANLLLGLGLYASIRRAFAGHSLRPLGLALATGLYVLLAAGLVEHAGLVGLGFYRARADLVAERLHSLFFHSGWLAEFVVVAAPFAVATALTGGRRGRAAGALLTALVVATLLFTQQRGAWFAALAQLVALAVLLRTASPFERRRFLWLALVLGLLIGALLGPVLYARPELARPVVTRLGKLTTDLSGRSVLWHAALGLTGERPLLGWGIGAFAPAYDQVYPRGSPEAFFFRGTAHNLYLHVTAERGVLGLGALLVVAWALWRGIRQAQRGPDPGKRALALGLLLSFTGFFVYGFVQYVPYLKNTEWLWWILLACASLIFGNTTARASRPLAKLLCGFALAAIPWRLAAHEPLTSASNYSFGLHEGVPRSQWRQTRWTQAQAAQRIPWKAETLRVELIDGHPQARLRDAEVTLKIDGQVVLSEAAPDVWKTYSLELGPPTKEWVVLQVEARPTFRPFLDFRSYPELLPSPDTRSLGVVLLDWEYESEALRRDFLERFTVARKPFFEVGAESSPAGHHVLRITKTRPEPINFFHVAMVKRVQGGSSYEVGFEYKTSDDYVGEVGLQVNFDDVKEADQRVRFVTESDERPLGDGWVSYSATFTAPKSARSCRMIFPRNRNFRAGTIRIRKPSLDRIGQ